MILAHNVQYRGLLLGLPILVSECSKQDQLEREARQRDWKLGFCRGQTVMKWTEIFYGTIPVPWPIISRGIPLLDHLAP